jgi:hypothetical protein
MNELKPNIELTFDQIKNDYLAVRELTKEKGTYKGDRFTINSNYGYKKTKIDCK